MPKKEKSHRKVLTEIYDRLYGHFGPQHWWPGDTPFEIAVGAILTQNTNWGNVEKAITNLKKEKKLSARALHAISRKKLASLIRPAGYFNIKADRLKHFIDFLADHYNGSMKKMGAEETMSLRERLLNVKGIGPETADSILLYALEKPVFVIDAYTKRILSRHKLVSEKMVYHDLQDIFHENLPQDVKLFNEYHALIVMLGKEFCRPKPKCDGCPLQSL
ncbi:putative A/G-specific adenine glycosylase YfhQ [bacterium BMS3Bbin09]|nr:putative A/G-specific adenine glycosylase YfhQ [bacterium BMS3Bbin09]